ncbi:unnamed protein product [Closterium sp. NIES-53]
MPPPFSSHSPPTFVVPIRSRQSHPSSHLPNSAPPSPPPSLSQSRPSISVFLGASDLTRIPCVLARGAAAGVRVCDAGVLRGGRAGVRAHALPHLPARGRAAAPGHSGSQGVSLKARPAIAPPTPCSLHLTAHHSIPCEHPPRHSLPHILRPPKPSLVFM